MRPLATLAAASYVERSKPRPIGTDDVFKLEAALAADWPRLAETQGSLEHDLALDVRLDEVGASLFTSPPRPLVCSRSSWPKETSTAPTGQPCSASLLARVPLSLPRTTCFLLLTSYFLLLTPYALRLTPYF